MSYQLIQGNALALPLEDASVDLIVTSPPYFGLRSYQDNGEHYAGQLGSEPTPAEFLDALIAATREMVRVLKPSGSIWVNLGDKYATTCPPGSGGKGIASKIQQTHPGSYTAEKSAYQRPNNGGIQAKSLIGIPWRYALRCIDDLGLILRAEVIWSKPNGLPESVTDRVRRSHETWFHFTVRPRYYAAVDEVREAHSLATLAKPGWVRQTVGSGGQRNPGEAVGQVVSNVNSLGKLPGSVWTVPTQPLTVPAELGVDHFAAFPMEWPRRIIRGWSPPGVCTGCGEGRRPVSLKSFSGSIRNDDGAIGTAHMRETHGLAAVDRGEWGNGVVREIVGYACGCEKDYPLSPLDPAVVLDPFGGTGTTALVAHALGRHGISVDMSADYCRLAAWRCADPGQLAAALQVDKPEPVADDQMELFA